MRVAIATVPSDQAFYIPAILKQLRSGPVPARHRAHRAASPLLLRRRNRRRSRARGAAGRSRRGLRSATSSPSRCSTLGLSRLGHHVFRKPARDLGAAGRRDATPSDHEDGREHARGLLPSSRAGVRRRRVGDRRVPARAGGARARGPSVTGLLHPTTAAFFAVFLLPAIWVTEPRARRLVGVAITRGWSVCPGCCWPDRSAIALTPMDAEWRACSTPRTISFRCATGTPAPGSSTWAPLPWPMGTLAYRVSAGACQPARGGTAGRSRGRSPWDSS